MTETPRNCDRCGEPLAQDPVVVTVASGPLFPTHPTIRLCGHCADSMSHWMRRKRWSHRTAPESSGREGARRPSYRDPGRLLGKDEWSLLKRRSMMMWGLILVLLASGLVFTVLGLAQFLNRP